MATTTMRLGLLLIFALAIIQISKAELENEDERQIEQKPEGNLMASSMEEVELRNVREAGNNKPGRKPKRRKSKNAKKKKRQNKKKGRRKGRKNKTSNGRKKKKTSTGRRKKKGSKKTGKKKSNKKGGKKKKKSGSKKRKFKKKKDKDLKKKKLTKKFGKKTGRGVSVRQTCDEAKLCQKIKDYIKYSNQLRKVKRIVKSCETMEKKANKSATEFDATVAALDTVIASNAKRRLYIRWRRTQRSTDEVVAIRDNLKNCSVSAKAKCERKVEPACGETALHTECEAALQDWVNKFGPSKGSCLQANADCCACITALAEVDAKCLDFDTKSNNAVKSKKKCTGTDTGSFGFCRKQQQEASVKGPPAACGGGGGSATKAPSSGTTAAATAAGATTAKPQDRCCTIIRRKNETYIHIDGWSSQCSIDRKGDCAYASETDLKNKLQKPYCLSELNESTCCSLNTGALCQNYGNKSNVNIEPTGTCSKMCKEIHDCTSDPEDKWCECNPWDTGNFNNKLVAQNRNFSYSSYECLPHHVPFLLAGVVPNNDCSHYTCRNTYHYTEFKNSAVYMSCCTAPLTTAGTCSSWAHMGFDRNCCDTFCNVNSCKDMLDDHFGGSANACKTVCKNNVYSIKCSSTSTGPCKPCTP